MITIPKHKNKLNGKFTRKGQKHDWTEYKEIRNRLNGAIWKANKGFSEKLADCKDS